MAGVVRRVRSVREFLGAGIVTNPADYRWCSYGAALGGDKLAREGLREVVRVAERGQEQRAKGDGWLEVYRAWVFGKAEEVRGGTGGRVLRLGMSPGKARDRLADGGKLRPAEMLRCRLRYFTGGVALGSKVFVESLFHAERWRFAPERTQAAKVMRGGDAVWAGLRVLRAPRLELDGS